MAKYEVGQRVMEITEPFRRGVIRKIEESFFNGTGYHVDTDTDGKQEFYENEITPEGERSSWATGGDKPVERKKRFGIF